MNAEFKPPTSRELVDEVIRERQRRLEWLRAAPTRFYDLRRYYRTHIADMVNDWGMTVDPRNAGTDVPVLLPFTLDKRQREWIDWTIENWRTNQYGLTEKSRDVGVSWMIVGVSLSICDLFDDIAIGWGSFKKEKVDFRGDMGSIFEKGRAYLSFLPEEFRGGHVPAWHSFERRLLFPRTRASIIGEIGYNIGRGGRTTFYFVDEAAYLEQDKEVDAALSKNTKCRQDVSSVHGMGNTFAERAHKKGVRKFTFHWRDNPRFTVADYEKFLEDWGEVITAQELDINYQASLEGIVLPANWVNACIDAHLKIPDFPKGGELRSALDVADEGIDKNALVTGKGAVIEHVEDWSGKGSDLGFTTEKAFGILASRGIRRMRYDADGFGADVRSHARIVNRELAGKEITVDAFRGSSGVLDPEREMVQGRKNEDYFLNFKSQSWIWLRQRVYETYRAIKGKPYKAEMLVSLSGTMTHLQRLLIELSQPTYSLNLSGKILIDKKPDGKPSPNLADAVMMYYAPARKEIKIPQGLLQQE